jgi:serpin B
MSSIDTFEFALRIQNVLSSDNTNLVVSPFSLTSALAITLYGTRGNSGAQLSKVLFGHQIDVNDYQSMVQEFQSLTDKCLEPNANVLSSANFIYNHKEYPILPDFSQTIDKYFSAKSQVLNFIDGNAEAIKTINEDISRATNGKIPTVLQSIDKKTKMILANAVYFKGLWKSQFESDFTKLDKFTTNSKQEVEVDMMFQRGEFPFAHSEQLNCKAIELGYEKSNIVMIVLLPDEHNSLKRLKANLNVESFDNLLNKLHSQEVRLSLPKFKLESTLELIPVLAKLGIKDIFDPKVANFCGITNDPLGLFVGEIIQKAVIEVNEEGTEAAAATVVKPTVFCDDSKQFWANRPFMFFLMSKLENNENVILFSGTFNNPKLVIAHSHQKLNFWLKMKSWCRLGQSYDF